MKLLKTITATKKSCKIIKANNCYQMKLLKPTKKKKKHYERRLYWITKNINCSWRNYLNQMWTFSLAKANDDNDEENNKSGNAGVEDDDGCGDLQSYLMSSSELQTPTLQFSICAPWSCPPCHSDLLCCVLVSELPLWESLCSPGPKAEL